jgi:hypothetical protein
LANRKIEEAIEKTPKHWSLTSPKKGDYQLSVENASRHKGKNCGYVKSMVAKPEPSAIVMQFCSVEAYLGRRLRMSAWVKSALSEGTGLLWLRIDGNEWRYNCKEKGYYDNMSDRPIKGTTDWRQYFLVVDVPKTSTCMNFGIMHTGKGTLWLDDFSFEAVTNKVPLTASFPGPSNLSFEETED